MLKLLPHRPQYIIGCDVANEKDSSVTVTLKRTDGVLEVISGVRKDFFEDYQNILNDNK